MVHFFSVSIYSCVHEIIKLEAYKKIKLVFGSGVLWRGSRFALDLLLFELVLYSIE